MYVRINCGDSLLHFELVSILEILPPPISRYYTGGTGSSVCDRIILFCGIENARVSVS